MSTNELDRRTLLKGAAVGAAGAAALDAPAEAQDRGALKDAGISTETVTFKNGDANINGFLARPKAAGKYGTVIIVPGIFGVTDQIKETTAQVAQAGLVGLAVNFYSRTSLPLPTDFPKLREFVGEHAPDKQIVTDVQAAINYLKRQGYTNQKFGVTGFCMGGRITLLAAAMIPDVSAASPYYGPVRSGGPANVAPLDVVSQIKVPVQGHYGATDTNPKPDDVREFYAKLKETSPHVEYHIYEGAGHAFQDWTRPSYNAAAAGAAWPATLTFFKKHLK
jgi:carboxymethylenebutenolidase